jgi:hypothetical protein
MNQQVGANQQFGGNTVNRLPKRDTVVSQDYRGSNDQAYLDNMLGANLQKVAANHQSIMSPIR